MALKLLSALDNARTQYCHFKAIIIAGMGLFTDAYDLFCIPPIMRLIGRIYFQHIKDPKSLYEIPTYVGYPLVAIALLGTVIGNLVFGYLGDRFGRCRVYGVALVLMVMSSFGCGFSVCTSPACVLASLGFFRFLLGVAIGGDYPLSATIMSEFANKMTRGRFIAAVFSMQGLGILVSSTVTMAVCAVFNAVWHPNVDETPTVADWAWRIILVIGAIPAGMTFYWRMMMPETARYTALVEQNVKQAAKNMEKVLDLPLSQITEHTKFRPKSHPPYPFLSKEFLRRHGLDLFACATTWFLVDIVFYSTNLVQSLIYEKSFPKAFPPKEQVNAFEDAFNVAKFQALVAIFSTIPGYWATVFFIDRIGRVKIQIIGFFFMALALFAVGIPYLSYWHYHKNNNGFVILYGLVFFFSNFGPNTTTFIVPAELFPARFRSTCHGISGAFGKIGAIVGSVGFLWAAHKDKNNDDDNPIRITLALVILGGLCIVGMIITYLFTLETMGRSLEENEENEDDNTHQELYFLRSFPLYSSSSNSFVASK